MSCYTQEIVAKGYRMGAHVVANESEDDEAYKLRGRGRGGEGWSYRKRS